jgi:hypothetical protein
MAEGPEVSSLLPFMVPVVGRSRKRLQKVLNFRAHFQQIAGKKQPLISEEML